MTTEPEPSPPQVTQYQQIHNLVQAEFAIEEGFIEHDIPTFYVTLQPNSKQTFLRLYKQLDQIGLVPFFKKRDDKYVLQIVPKPEVKPGRNTTNIALLLATIATTLISGYVLSLSWTEDIPNPIIGALMFTAALMAIFGAHEMAHKLAANKHGVEATYPYFIPGLPYPLGIGTFGAVIQQKSMTPNRDALFDLGMSGPVMGFLVTIVVTIIGISMSKFELVTELPQGSFQVPLLLDFLAGMLMKFPSVSDKYILINLHPLGFAGYIGMIVTMLNLLPAGQLDGGHVARVLLGDRARSILGYIAILALVLIGAWLMAILVLFLIRYPHPGSLDDVSQLSKSRKIATIALIVIFVLTVSPLYAL
jgi:membrane-associated protease RseP (regulator of RpoE activity)